MHATGRLNILLVEPFAHRAGHPSSYPKYLGGALCNVGANVTVATFARSLDWLGDQIDLHEVSVTGHGGSLALIARLFRWSFQLAAPLRRLSTLLETVLVLFLAFRLRRTRRYHAIHVLDTSMPPLSFLVFGALVRSSTLVCTLHNPSSLELSGRSKFIDAVNALLYRRATQRNRVAFVCQTKQVKDSYVNNVIHDNLAYIPFGVGRLGQQGLTRLEARKNLGLPADGTFFLSFGDNHPRKNFEVIFQAVHDVPREFRLLFVGKIRPENQPINDPRRLAREYDCSETTVVLDRYVCEREKQHFFSAADAAILSYTKKFLGASDVLSEAAQFGLPVIASDVGQLGEFVREFNLGLAFAAEDAESLREAICAFLHLDEGQKQEIRQNLQAFASAHSWREVAKRHLELYQSLPEGKR